MTFSIWTAPRFPRRGAVVLGVALILGCKADRQTPPATQPAVATRPVEQTHLPSPAEIVAASIRAHGGESALSRADIGRTKARLRGSMLGAEADMTVVDVFRLPGFVRRVAEGTIGGEALHVTSIWNGDSSWHMKKDGTLYEGRNDLPAMALFPDLFLTQLRQGLDPSLTLSTPSGPDALSADQRTVRVEEEGVWVADLLFDTKTHFLVAARTPLAEQAARRLGQASTEARFSHFRDIAGMRLPSATTVQTGANRLEITLLSYEALPAVDDSLFAPPQGPATAPAVP